VEGRLAGESSGWRSLGLKGRSGLKQKKIKIGLRLVGDETISIVGNESRRHKQPCRPQKPVNLIKDPSITRWQVMVFSEKARSCTGKKEKCPMGIQFGGDRRDSTITRRLAGSFSGRSGKEELG